MMTTAPVFEIEPFHTELFGEAQEIRRASRPAARVSSAARTRNLRRWPPRQDSRRSAGDALAGSPSATAWSEPAADQSPARRSEYVSWVQATLNRALGTARLVDGIMSASTRAAIRDFQRHHRLPVSGYVGPDTEAALRRVGADVPSREWEFEWEFELSGNALTAENALKDKSKALTVECALACLGRNPMAGLYRFTRSDDRFYTGMSMDLRRRILDHLWCLSHLGVSARGYRLNLFCMPHAGRDKVRKLEIAINGYHKIHSPKLRLNVNTELEFQQFLDT